VALKVVRVGKTDPEMLEAERNGVSLQAQLACVAPQVAAVFETGQDGDFFWVAMEYVDGTDLSEVIAAGPLPEPRAVAIALGLASMLEICHNFSAEVSGRRIYGIVHGDIKPENIRLQAGDRVRVIDFGIAKHLTQTRRFTVNLFGSLPYTPPERLERGVVDRHSDLWAAGVVLAAMVLGRRPFRGDTPEELEQVLRRGGPRLPLPPSCSPGLAHVVDRALAFEVGRRYQTAGELAADLTALHEGRTVEVPPTAAAGAAGDVHATRRTARPPAGVAAVAAEATRRTDRLAEGATVGAVAGGAPGASGHTGGAAAVGALGATGSTGAAGAFGSTGAAGAFGDTRRTGAAPAFDPPMRFPAPVPVAPAAVAGPAGAAGLAGSAGLPAGSGGVAATGGLAGPVALAAAPAAVAPPRPRRRIRRLFALLVAVALLAFGGAQLRAWNQAQQLRRDLAEAQPDLDALAARYQEAERWCWVSVDLFGVGDELLRALNAEAGRILDSYHGDDPTTTQRGWQLAYDHLHAAAQIAPRDHAVRARMLYAHAHLDRIQSLVLRAQDRKRSLDMSRQAAAEFQQASQWDPTWADPFLGLARIYAYDLFDLDALQKTLGELARRGYRLGRRETAMLADGFRMRGLGTEARADRAGGGDAEAELLKQAREDLSQAVHYYGDIGGYAYAAANRADCQSHINAIDARLAAHHEAGFWERVSRALVHEFAKPNPGPGGGKN
jgi:hypothetical protein